MNLSFLRVGGVAFAAAAVADWIRSLRFRAQLFMSGAAQNIYLFICTHKDQNIKCVNAVMVVICSRNTQRAVNLSTLWKQFSNQSSCEFAFSLFYKVFALPGVAMFTFAAVVIWKCDDIGVETSIMKTFNLYCAENLLINNYNCFVKFTTK